MQVKKMTLKGLAQILGVHSSTVGRVMDPATRHMVGAELAQRVLQEAARHGYQPNKIAAALKTRRSNIVGVMLPDITNPVFPPILLGIEDELRKHGYVALVSNAGEDPAEQRYFVEQLMARQVDALILATATRSDMVISHCLDMGISLVTVNRNEDRSRTSSVVNDEYVGMQLAVDHLLSLGHRKIVYLAGPQNLSTGYQRRLGYIAAMADSGIMADRLLMIDCSSYSRAAGRVACSNAFILYPDVTAILASNDLLALGCYEYLNEQGLRCPEDVSVIGHNDMPFVDMVHPALTTVRINHSEMGIQAAQLILRSLQDRGSGNIEIRLKPELIVRHSTKMPRSYTMF